MTIDEAIRDYEQMEVAAKALHQKSAFSYTSQMVKWLKELKIHREIHEILLQTLVDFDLDMCCEDLTDDAEEAKICEENCDKQCPNCWVRWARLKVRQKADGSSNEFFNFDSPMVKGESKNED